jgi:hypothetical protein
MPLPPAKRCPTFPGQAASVSWPDRSPFSAETLSLIINLIRRERAALRMVVRRSSGHGTPIVCSSSDSTERRRTTSDAAASPSALYSTRQIRDHLRTPQPSRAVTSGDQRPPAAGHDPQEMRTRATTTGAPAGTRAVPSSRGTCCARVPGCGQPILAARPVLRNAEVHLRIRGRSSTQHDRPTTEGYRSTR